MIGSPFLLVIPLLLGAGDCELEIQCCSFGAAEFKSQKCKDQKLPWPCTKKKVGRNINAKVETKVELQIDKKYI